MVEVLIPSQLQSYTGGLRRTTAAGTTIDEVLRDLDRSFPGIRFRVIDEQDRVRPHIKLFVGRDRATDIRAAIEAGAELMIFGALSGG